jgi:hypothetical protein
VRLTGWSVDEISMGSTLGLFDISPVAGKKMAPPDRSKFRNLFVKSKAETKGDFSVQLNNVT